jgi:hypothetical protein
MFRLAADPQSQTETTSKLWRFDTNLKTWLVGYTCGHPHCGSMFCHFFLHAVGSDRHYYDWLLVEIH